jgi:hypothetical protein
MIKFNFLSHSGSGADNLIHEVAYILVGLCSGNKELVQRYSSPWRILYSDLNEEKSLDWDHSRALCQDVANLTRECVKDFLYEIKNFGKIMTSAELEEHNNALTAPTAEEDNYSDDEFETYSDDDKLSSTDTSKNNQETQQNDASLSIENDITEEENSNSSEIKADYDSKPNLVLEFILSWINELPQWLQDKILDSSPIKSLVESIEQTSAMYDKKSVSDIFTISQSFEASDSLQNEVEDNRQEKVKLCDLPSEGAIDMTMIWKEPTVNGWILPMVGIESGNMFEDDAAFNGLNNFYGHGFIVF